ncbi:MAG: hypothetical protein QOE91_317 [Gaiellaceae bacterium]|nr:hypothetical protein [Gaiellaceae bacterium]
MTERGYEVATLDELDRIPVMHGLEWRPIRRRFGIRAFGVNAYTAAKPGDWIVEEHDETALGHEEMYVVVRGRATFTLNGETVDAPAGTIVFLEDPSVKRLAIAEEEGTTVLAVGAKPGEAFKPSVWEWVFEGYAKTPDEAIAIVQDGIREVGEEPAFYYHLACFSAQAGRKEEARSYLERALEERPDWRERAAQDDDLAGLLKP